MRSSYRAEDSRQIADNMSHVAKMRGTVTNFLYRGHYRITEAYPRNDIKEWLRE